MQILLLIGILIYVCTIIYYYKKRKKIYKKYIQKKKKEIDKELADRTAYSERLTHIIKAREQTIQLLVKELKTYEQQQKESIDRHIEALKEIKTNETLNQIAQEREQMIQKFEEEKKQKQNEMDQISLQLESFRAKQDTINQEILRRRELEEQADFYRVCLSEDAIADITLLQITRQKLKKPEIIDKIIYDTYVAKPVLEMIKRVLQNSTCSGIYKITCQETKEIYIGKSTDIKNRWQQHCKTAFNCGIIASSILHRKMQQYGIENFTFELLEKVPKDQLTEREKYYIDFYKTKETGLNERNG